MSSYAPGVFGDARGERVRSAEARDVAHAIGAGFDETVRAYERHGSRALDGLDLPLLCRAYADATQELENARSDEQTKQQEFQRACDRKERARTLVEALAGALDRFHRPPMPRRGPD